MAERKAQYRYEIIFINILLRSPYQYFNFAGLFTKHAYRHFIL